MANFYSDHLGANPTTLKGLQERSNVSIRGANMYKHTARITLTSAALPGTSDVVRMLSMESGHSLHELKLSSDAGFGAGTINVGLYEKGNDNHEGGAIDATLFASAVDVATSALDDTNVFNESGTLGGVDRGKTLWELADIGAGTFTENPFRTFDIVFVPTVALTTGGVLTLTAYYVAGT